MIRGLRAWVVARSGDEREVLDVVRTAERQRPRWLDFTADLSRWAGREVTLEFHAALDGLPAEHRHTNLVAWGPVRLSTWTARKRPNVLFILVDTLRFDHLTPYGYPRDTSPNIARTVAGPGAVVEYAYSQAPWTLPSVASFMTSRQPGEVLGGDPRAYGIPARGADPGRGDGGAGLRDRRLLRQQDPALRERLRPRLRHVLQPARDPAAQAARGDDQPDAAELTGRVLPWVEAHRNQPVLPLRPLHRSPRSVRQSGDRGQPLPLRAPCPGCVSGRHIQGVYAGKLPLKNPERDTEHLKALYDSEIHYADRFIGRLIDALAAGRAAEHPDRADRRPRRGVPGPRRVEARLHPLRGADPRAAARPLGRPHPRRLAPARHRAAARPRADPRPGRRRQGAPLLGGGGPAPALAGKAPLPRLAAFAQHMMIGPLRAAAVLDGRKLFLFNPRTPLHARERARGLSLDAGPRTACERVELYDLARDAKERNNLAPSLAGADRALQPIIHRQLNRELPGLRVFASGFPAGSRVQGSIALDRPPSGWDSYFLAEGDRVELAGNRVSFDLGGETVEKGFRLEGDVGGVQTVEARVDGRPLPAGQMLVGRGTPYPGGGLNPAALDGGGSPCRQGRGAVRSGFPAGGARRPAMP